jgi:hypothetical protein
MSPDDDTPPTLPPDEPTIPPPPSTPTLPLEPPESASELPIVAGDAMHTVLAAFANLTRAVLDAERVAVAACRALDAMATKEPQR